MEDLITTRHINGHQQLLTINNFGVRIDSYPPSGNGSVVINYDLVEVTVEYSQPVTITGG
jgi:hypothetical protein